MVHICLEVKETESWDNHTMKIHTQMFLLSCTKQLRVNFQFANLLNFFSKRVLSAKNPEATFTKLPIGIFPSATGLFSLCPSPMSFHMQLQLTISLNNIVLVDDDI